MKKNVTFLTILWLASCFAAFSQEEKEVKHESDPQYEVHQYLAGESAKVWPGWSGNVYSVKVTVHAIKCPKTDDWFGDNLYFKFYVNDGFRLFNKNGGYNYSRNKEGWVTDLETTNNTVTVTIRSFDILSIGLVGMDKDYGFGQLDDDDDPLGKVHFVKVDNRLEYYERKTITGSDGIMLDYSITFSRLSTGTASTAQKEIHSYIGTKLILDTYKPTDPNGYSTSDREQFYSTYTGYLGETNGLIWGANSSALEKSYLYYNTMPYSNFDKGKYGYNAFQYATDGNNDIIEGTHEEDVYNMDYFPANIWTASYGGRDGISRNSFFYMYLGIPYNTNIFANHFWDPDQANDFRFNVGGHDGGIGGMGAQPNAASAPYKAQLIWDYYVLPQYYAGNKNNSYYNLGRTLHLLEDMSALAHIHRDAHGAWVGGKIDYYEVGLASVYVNGQVESKQIIEPFTYLTANGAITNSLGLDPKIKQEWLNHGWNETILNQQTPLFRLFYSLAEYSDEYPSRDVMGDNPAFHTKDWEYYNWRAAADTIMPKAISHIAGLYMTFWMSTHFPFESSYSRFLDDEQPTVATALKQTYNKAFNAGAYLGSPTADGLVKISGNNFYRKYNHGILFWNSNLTDNSGYIADNEGNWAKILLKYIEIGENTGRLGLPTKRIVENGNETVYFEYGKIYWGGLSAIVVYNKTEDAEFAAKQEKNNLHNQNSNVISQQKNVQTGNDEKTFVKLSELNVYPNPSTGKFNVSISERNNRILNVRVFNLTGKIILNQKINDDLFEINISEKGLFFIEIRMNNEVLQTKVIVQ